MEILLITSRETKRWVIPKGWLIPRLKDFMAAKHEALEEAGVIGRISKTALGTYCYEKRQKGGGTLNCCVSVFPLQVNSSLRRWKEKEERVRKWFSAEAAEKLVQEPALKAIISRFV